MISQQDQSQNQSRITVRLLDFIDLHPSHIQHLSYSPSTKKLLVARKSCTQIYHITAVQNPQAISIDQILVFEPCDQVYEIDGLFVFVFPFQIKINHLGKWIVYPFTTQTLPLSTRFDLKSQKLYTFHINQCRQWSISKQEGVSIRHLAKHQTPYHITSEGSLQGLGKKIKLSNLKDNKFTVIQQSQCGRYVFIGTSKGQLHVYQTKFLTHIKTFHRHQGAILTIKSIRNMCYFTGSDSKISSIVLIQGDNNSDSWNLSKQIRGQSHDIMSIQYLTLEDNSTYLLSGGITTDVCFYKLLESGVLTDEWSHKVCYSNENLAFFQDNYIIVNKYMSFQVWKIRQILSKSKQSVQLLVKYQMPFYKNIRHLIVKSHQNFIIIFVCTQQQANLWQFNEQSGLVKLLTVKNSYNLVSWYKKQCIMTLRDGNRLQIFNFKNGNIKQIAQTQVQYPTDLILSAGSQNRIIIGSKISQKIQIYQIDFQKGKKRIIQLDLQKCYDVIDFCYYNLMSLVIKFNNDDKVYQMDKKGKKINEIVKLPLKKIRKVGWLPITLKQKKKLFWYAVGEGKIVIVSRMKTYSKDKKVRVKQMPRIADIIVNSLDGSQWNIGVIPLNFKELLQNQIKPIMVKKVL